MWAVALSLSITSNADAAVITHGYLTFDDTTPFITDTQTGQLYTRLDAFKYTYEQLTALLANSPGWSLATSDDADAFIKAILGGTSSCLGTTSHGATCGTINGWIDGDFGPSSDEQSDYFMFESTHPAENLWDERDVGRVRIRSYDPNIFPYGIVSKYDDYLSFEQADESVEWGSGIHYLLTKRPVVVPLPAAVWLFGSALVGLGLVARKRKGVESN